MSNTKQWKYLPSFFLSCWLLIAISTANAATNTTTNSALANINEHQLKNGLKVVLAPNDKAQVIAFNLVYLTGALADPAEQGGTAHLLEHLMFKGTKKLPNGRLVDEMTRRGMQFNASTSYDRTLYHAAFASDEAQLDWLLSLEADRMVNAQFNQADMQKEIPVVLREREIAQGNPVNALNQELIALQTGPQGYGRNPLSTRGEVENLTLDQVQKFYRTYYRPDNAVLIVTANLIRKTFLHVSGITWKYYRTVPALHAYSPAALDQKIEPSQATHVNLKRGDTPVVVNVYAIPAAADPVTVELGVLVDALAGGAQSRLYQALVSRGKAVAVAANPLALRGKGFFFFTAVLNGNQSAPEAQSILSETIENLNRQPITAEELAHAKNMFANAQSRLVADPVALGNVLAENAAAGDWKFFFNHLKRLSTLSVDDVQKAAAEYLTRETRTTGQVIPSEADLARASDNAAERNSENKLNNFTTPSDVGSQGAEKPRNVLPSFPAVKDAETEKLDATIQRFSLTNGLKVGLLPASSAGGRITGQLKLRFGDEKSLFAKRQVADLTATMLTYGTRRSTQQQLADRLNTIGVTIAVVPDDDHVAVQFDVSRASLIPLLELMAEMLREPAFPTAELEVVRRSMQTGWNHQRNAPEIIANEELTRRTNPYPTGDMRRPPSSREKLDGLANIARDDLVRFHADFYGADNGELAIVGDIDPAQTRAALERLLGNWKSKAEFHRPPQPFYAAKPGAFVIPAPGKDYGYYLARVRFPVRDDALPAAALMIANQILGGKPVGARLTERLRNQEGLSYKAGTRIVFSSFEDAGHFTIVAAYPPARREQIQAAVHDELSRFVKNGITDAELHQAQETLLQQSRQARSIDSQLLAMLPMQLRTGRTMQFMAQRDAAIRNASVDAVNTAIRQYLDPEQLVEIFADTAAAETQAQ